MTALDTTNLRLTFTPPAHGTVLVRLKAAIAGATTHPVVLLGVLDGSTVKLRLSPQTTRPTGSVASARSGIEAVGLVTGLTPGNSYTWDAAYGVEEIEATASLRYGGPNDTTSNNSNGGFSFEIWETSNLLAGKAYDPSTAGSAATTSTLAMTAIDTTNLRHTITAPASGNVFVRMHCVLAGASPTASIILGVLEGATVRLRTPAQGGNNSYSPNSGAADSHFVFEGTGLITGLTPGNSYTFDMAYGVEVTTAATGIKYGGPDNTTDTDAWGAICFELWAA